MDDRELERRLAELGETWRVPREQPFERMWQDIEMRAFPSAVARTRTRWVRTLLPLAAMLILGFGLGRWSPLAKEQSASQGQAVPGASARPVRNAAEGAPFVGIATDYLERVTALLVTLADAHRGGGQSVEYSTSQARDLLVTTRLLLDSPEARDPHLQALLNDLELVLAQIVRLPQHAPAPDVYLIDQAVDQREVLPRLREMLAENSSSQP
jgi:hypothetical protein